MPKRFAIRLVRHSVAKVELLIPQNFSGTLHIANATIHKADILVSWNFKHIVNIDKIRMYNAVNLMFGHSSIEIRTPREILKETDDEN
jgi:hypothetical protein